MRRDPHPKHYVGLEISGLLHLGSLILGYKINDFLKAGMKCKVYLADYHSYINNKWGGDWEKIQQVAKDYDADAFTFYCPGVEIEYGSELYHNNDEYWKRLIRFSKQITLARDTRCLTIMGRTAKEKLDVAQYLYPPMQATDIKAMDLDVVHAGLDQRKVHMLGGRSSRPWDGRCPWRCTTTSWRAWSRPGSRGWTRRTAPSTRRYPAR